MVPHLWKLISYIKEINAIDLEEIIREIGRRLIYTSQNSLNKCGIWPLMLIYRTAIHNNNAVNIVDLKTITALILSVYILDSLKPESII